jgi:hypothetical protein
VSPWTWLFTGAVVLGALGVLLDVRRGRPRDGVSLTRIGLGLGVSLLAVASAGVLIGVDVQPPPEQRGIGVEVAGLSPPLKARGYDRGLTLAMAVKVTECDKPVQVQITLAPTAEFWIDNHEALASKAVVRFAIPDDLAADASVDEALSDPEAWMGTDGLAPFVTAVPKEPAEVVLHPTATKESHATFITISVPEWGSTLNPLTVQFLADWTHHRSFLGGCYVSLPAVAGLPTVLSTAQLAGRAAASPSDLPSDNANLFVVSSKKPPLYAYYDEGFEVTRGVTSLELGDHTLQEGASLPAPNANLGGAPAWTCRSTIPQSFRYGGLKPGDPAEDVFALLQNDATFSFSDQRLAQILRQRTCASFVAIEAASAGTRRDLLLIAVGTVIALGIELLLSGVKRSRLGQRNSPPSAQGL